MNSEKQPLFVYTSGCADVSIWSQWNYTFLPLIQKITDSPLIIRHYDKKFLMKEKSYGEKVRNNLVFEPKYLSNTYEYSKAGVKFDELLGVKEDNYIYFDFAHLLDHTKEQPYKYIYYPYEGRSKNVYAKYFKPFTIDINGKIETFVQKLRAKKYKVIEKDIEFDSYKKKYKYTFKIKTIEFEGKVFDNKDKFIMLLEIIREYGLIDLATDIQIKGFLKQLLTTKITINSKIDFPFDMTRILQCLQDAKKYDKSDTLHYHLCEHLNKN